MPNFRLDEFLAKDKMGDIGQRIKQLREKLGLSQSKFAEKIGKSRIGVAQWEAGKRTPDESTLKLIAKEFNVNEEWLKTGEGKMFVKELPATSKEEYIEVPLYDIYASAGEGIANYEETPKPIKIDEWFARMVLGLSSTNGVFLIKAYGDSMYPTIKSGDYLIGRFWEYEGFLLEGAVYIFRIGNELFIKRFRRDRANKKLIFTADNPNYESIIISEDEQEEIVIIGRMLKNLADL